jgi:hypothetical protein
MKQRKTQRETPHNAEKLERESLEIVLGLVSETCVFVCVYGQLLGTSFQVR